MTRGVAVAIFSLLLPVSAAAQGSTPASGHRDAFWYGRFGWGTIANDATFGGIGFGFGRRLERDRFVLDLLLFDAHVKTFGTAPDLHEIGGVYTHAAAASFGTVKALYLLRPAARATPYVGAGAGWSALSFGRSVGIDEQWHGKGLHGAITAGYALTRAPTSTRYFVQADFTRPFFRAERYSDRRMVTGDRYAPTLVVSLGAGW